MPADSWLRRPATALLALMLAGAALRFATLNVQSIWLDESATMILVHRSFQGMLSNLTASESAPPLYYALVWVWTKAFGAGPLGFRSFSALVGTITIPVMYAAGRRISPRAGLWAAALTVVNPAMYYFSQEARAYGLLVLFAAAALVLWQRALAAPDRRSLALWAAMSSLALLTHYFAVFLFVPEAWILLRRLGARRAAAPVGAVLAVGAALLPLALAQQADGKVSWIEAESLASRFAESVKLMAVGPYAPLEILAGLLIVLLAAGAVALGWRRTEGRERAAVRDVAVVAVVSIGLPLALAAIGLVDVYDGRNVIASWVPLAVLVAAGLGVTRAGRAGPLLGAGICAISAAVIAAINLTPAYQRSDWRGIARALPGAPAGGEVVVGEQFASMPLSIYLGPLREAHAAVSTRRIEFVALPVRRAARSPLPPVVPTSPPRGFRWAGVQRTSAYAISSFSAPRPTLVSVKRLRREQGEAKAEVLILRR